MNEEEARELLKRAKELEDKGDLKGLNKLFENSSLAIEDPEDSLPAALEEEGLVDPKDVPVNSGGAEAAAGVGDAATCIATPTESPQIERTAKDVKAVSEAILKKNAPSTQKISDGRQMHLEAKEIENQLKNAIDRFEIDTQLYEVAIEPIEKEIIRLQNEINGHLPLTFGKLVTEIAEVFGYNEFGTHESRQREIEKKEFEIRKKEREILDSVIEELKTSYNEGVLFFNSYPSIREKSFPSIYLNEWELPEKSQEMLSEFSKLRANQNSN